MKSVSKIPYIVRDTMVVGRSAVGRHPEMDEDLVMTFEILQLTAQIQRWLNRQIARHLAEQAERLAR